MFGPRCVPPAAAVAETGVRPGSAGTGGLGARADQVSRRPGGGARVWVPQPVRLPRARPLRRLPIRTVAAALVTAIVLSACSSGSAPAPAPSPSPSPSPSPTLLAPLTGLPVRDPTVLQRPPLAVKVENSRPARPQAGLDLADVVFEEVTEGGVTRFIAIFHSQLPEEVGPIRSARFVDAEVLPPFGAVFAISGAAPVVLRAVAAAGIETLVDDGSGHPFYRVRGRRAPHDLFARPADLYDAAQGRGTPARPAWPFDPTPPPGAERCPAGATPAAPPAATPCEQPGQAIDVRMSGSSVTGWRYDPATGRYLRLQDGEPALTADGRPMSAATVVVIATNVRPSGCCDPAGNPLTATDVVGGGRAVILRDGRWYEAHWEKPSAASQFSFTHPAVGPFPFAPGPVWILLAPREGVPGPVS